MNDATNYRYENKLLMEEYENKVRKWLEESGNNDIASIIPFFRDGIVCPEKWFNEGNDFRPLFILKEVSLGFDDSSISRLNDFMENWGWQKHFEFVENPFDDIRIGTFRQWRRIAKLAKGLEDIHNGAEMCDYNKYDLSFKEGGDLYIGNIKGYKDPKRYLKRTGNAIYNDIMDKIAVIEIKKVGGGTNTSSKLSLKTRYYTEHIDPFNELLCRQIKLIDPTVVICLGRENGNCISYLLENVKKESGERMWIEGCHHSSYNSNEKFYYEPLNSYKACIKRNK